MRTLVLLLLLLAKAACGQLCAQTFELKDDNLGIASVDGLWRFHTGDNPAWAKPSFDDSRWSLLRSDKGWSSQGYTDYSGMAWYRFQIAVPVGSNRVSLLLPSIDTCYEVFADGNLIGTYGRMPPNSFPYGGGGRFRAYSLPPTSLVKGKTQIALRVWHWPGWAKYYEGGPQHGGGLFGDSQRIERQVNLEGVSSYWEIGMTLIVALLETLAGMATLALFLVRRKEPEYLWFAVSMLLEAAGSAIQFSPTVAVINIEVRDLLEGVAYTGAHLASIAFYFQLLKPKRTWLLKLSVASLFLLLLERSFESVTGGSVIGVPFDALLGTAVGLAIYGWTITVVTGAAWRKSPDARLLLAPVTLIAGLALYGGLAWATYTVGWQHRFDGSIPLTNKPFPIDLSDVGDCFFLLAVFAILILRFTRTSNEEERFAKELQAAREVQQYLIPTQLPPTPGLRIDSEYRPSREVGGDFFQVLPNTDNGSVLIVLGDVAGKGLQAGMLATLIVGAIRTAVAFTGDPARILALLNERLQRRGLVTCLALIIGRDGESVLVNAGHLPPYLNGAEMPMEGALPLGAVPDVDFPVLHFQLVEHDTLMIMSDGIAEAQDAKGHLFGFERIGALLRARGTASELAAAAQQFGQEDDITVLTMTRMMPGSESTPKLTPE